MHTPGPWWVDDDGFVASGNGETYVTVADPHCAEVGDTIDIDELESNARLIAAAPELLAALRELVQYVRDEFSCSHPLHEAADRARSAISKAEDA